MDLPAVPDHVAELHQRLIDEPDALIRAGIHLELAGHAVANGQFESAARHFREALLLDHKLDRAHRGLRELGDRVPRPTPEKGGWRRLVSRFRPRART